MEKKYLAAEGKLNRLKIYDIYNYAIPSALH